ncbi:melanization protease 1 isoform X2 [Calliphora vicina]|uniref:melanization protease 1 isoform X2 n=1 Tax=Calliphora vicina TaxID=7373 RepID=UPI00325B8E4A
MFSLKIKINLNFCFCLLLANCVSKVVTFPAHNFSLCNCVLLQSCEAFNTFIDKSSDDAHIKAVIQEAVCYFDGLSIFVCCPDKLNHKRNTKEKPKLDYLDDLTGLNCPPSFGNEYNYDEYLKTHDEIEPKYYDNHSQNINYAYGEVNNNHHHDHTTMPVVCDELGNCAPYAYPHSNGPLGPQPYPAFHHHNHNHENDHNIGHDIPVPFFPHTHTNHHHQHDYPMERDTPRPVKKTISSCGMLPQVSSSNIEVYPWITRLAYLNTTSRTIRYRCMGTIISEQHILTAAHCVDQLVQDLRLIYVRIGDDTNFNDYQILETIVHPNYNEPLFNNDVALLRLAITSQSKGPLIQICLPQNNSNTLTGDTGVVAGWSNSGIPELNSSTIRYINLPIMNNTECAIRYAKYSENFDISIVITPTEFCAKAQAMNDVCEGDSGGPFMERTQSGRYTLLGIVAFGPKTNCGQSNLPGVYMRVSSYVDWIKSNIN